MPGDFGFKHLTGLAWLFSLITVLLVVLLIIKRKLNKGENFDRAVIRYTCYFMWIWEIIKTIRMINCDDYGPVGYYPLWKAPFQICSMGLYAYLIIGSKRNLKIAEWVKPFGFAVMLFVTSVILAIPGSGGILGVQDNWNFTFDNILPFQSFLYHGCLVFVPIYMVASGFYKAKWSDIYKATVVLVVCAIFSQSLNFIFEGSGADFMMLRYGNSNPLQFLLTSAPVLYYVIMTIGSILGLSIIIAVTILIQKLVSKKSVEKENI